MSNEYQFTVIEPVCFECGARLEPTIRELDWRTDEEMRLGVNAFALQLHRMIEHPVLPKVGDIVAYFRPWRGLVIGHGPYEVRSIWDHDIWEFARSMGADHEPVILPKYRLVNPRRESDYALPTGGRTDDPLTFTIIHDYAPEPVQTDLLDLLNDEWAA